MALGLYIADYPEQALLSCVMQGWCPNLVPSHFSQNVSNIHLFLKCTAPQSDPNKTEGVIHRCQAHTELLVHEFELGLLWDGWGIVGDVVVRLSISRFVFVFVCFTYHLQVSCLFFKMLLMPLCQLPYLQSLTLSHTAIHE